MDAAKPVEVTTDDGRLEARLREAGFRVTRPRRLVYRVLRELGGHRSVDDLVAALAERGSGLPRMTVYNVVSNLVRAGAVMRADAGPGRALYEVADVWHHHFVCSECGAIIDVPCAVGAKPCLQPALDDVEVHEAQVIFRGICGECRRGAKKKGRGR